MRRHPLLFTVIIGALAGVFFTVLMELLSPDPNPWRLSWVLIRVGSAVFFGGFMVVTLYFGMVRPALDAERSGRPLTQRDLLIGVRPRTRLGRVLWSIVWVGGIVFGAGLLIGGIVYSADWLTIVTGAVGLLLGISGLITQRWQARPGDDRRAIEPIGASASPIGERRRRRRRLARGQPDAQDVQCRR